MERVGDTKLNRILKGMYWFIFLFYLFLLTLTVFLGRSEYRSVNLIPFQTIKDNILVDDGIRVHLVDISVWANILMFIPAGIYIMFFSYNNSKRQAFYKVLACTIFIETIQYIFAIGAADVDDLILNGLGGAIGIAIYAMFFKVFKEKDKVEKAIAILSILIGMSVLILFVLLRILN